MKYLNLASGASHLTTPAVITEATINALKKGNTFYGSDEGNHGLRQAISKRYSEDYKAEISSENILITTGTKQAIFNLFSVLLKPGDEVILQSPGWFGFDSLLRQVGAKAIYLTTSAADNHCINPEKIEALITEKTRLFIYSNPNNPTGRVYTASEIKSLVSCLQKYSEIKILSDEIYDLVLFDNVEMASLVQFPEVADRAIIVNGFSKNFAMSGWRIGYLIAPPVIYKKCLEFQHTTISGTNPFIQEGAQAAIENRQQIMAEILPDFEKNRQLICNWLSKFPEINYLKPEGAYYIFADLSRVFQQKFFQKNGIVSTQKLCVYLKAEYNLDFVPGERFNAPGFIRITFAVTETDLKEALRSLEDLLNR